ncbi:bifunctional methylenetetrahydrofolate dehydrogenase/methenyltetrahydrofolate cyclohydrolase FolD [Alicyclobacillus sp. SP_1]|uniref:bifunctional methylenetetrahydrofolate dehydrogenase/methenyltetrahydrofolate cyclohydrolase FolD n=1 Tax=Alicyclobacillus sp. SP_1 TaxID=2942475 RepID=UPI002157AAC9|nr:bifunctional methylenetetrahydrofolate dehydrogenase/methenyltetrahydrofolate cyclohydrolase FolD [Alicyclobacillus sp. SP_1]
MSTILDGKKVANQIQEEIREAVQQAEELGRAYGLTVVIVGNEPASLSYVRSKKRAAEKVGIRGEIVQVSKDISQEALIAVIQELNHDSRVDGILVQLPLPLHLNAIEILSSIAPAKDVDGFHPENAGLCYLGSPRVWPCTPLGIMELLRRYSIDPRSKRSVVVGRSNIVGKPMSLLLMSAGSTVTTCHRQTKNLSEVTRQADILVVAAGCAGLIGGDDVQPGAVVIDVGNNYVKDRLVGDVRFAEVSEVAAYITPVPGGVGPLTVAMLLQNTVTLGKKRVQLGAS